VTSVKEGVSELRAGDPIGRRPTVSIGLPVHNGERYLGEAIDSIIAQTFTDFELIISDNASTDGSERLCRQYAASDRRVRYYRNDRNIGGSRNHGRAFSLARGRYFRFAAYDDVCAPELLSRCVEALDLHPEAVLSYAITVHIDEHGRRIGEVRQQKATSVRPSERLRDLIEWDHNCEPIYGLIRSDVLADIQRRMDLLPGYTDADRTLLGQLSLYGQFFQVGQPLFRRRIHSGITTKVFSGWRERMAWSFASGEDPITFPHWQQFLHYLRAIGAAPLSPGERLRCYGHMIRWISFERRWGKLPKDLYYAGLKLLRSSTGSAR
jgi:glycosyltransferase involved in cell wall biosynthesis